METLSNSILTVQIAEHGAELQSIKKDGKEYLWQGNAKFWGRRSPVLFPIVGRVWNNKYRHAGNTYEIGQHGFARDMDFKLTYKEDKGAVYWLESTPDTLGKFPFPFRLLVGYLLEENKITVKWRVENLGAMDMYFQIGAHPAFYFPEFDAATKDRGFFVFDRKSDLEYIMPTEKGCVSPERHVLKLNKEGCITRKFSEQAGQVKVEKCPQSIQFAYLNINFSSFQTGFLNSLQNFVYSCQRKIKAFVEIV